MAIRKPPRNVDISARRAYEELPAPARMGMESKGSMRMPFGRWKEGGGPLGCSRDSVVRLVRGGHVRAVEFPRMGGRGMNVKRQIPESELKRFLARSTNRR